MSFVAVAIGSGAVLAAGATVYASSQQAAAANQAAHKQSQAAKAGIAEQKRQFDAIQKLLAPYVQAGAGALTGQQDLAGLNGPEAQQKAIDALQSSPQFASMIKQGETGILQNAAATGGVRGGNTQGALATYRPAMLNQLISDQYNRLGGLVGIGQASAAGQAAAGQNNANMISSLLQQQGQAQAGAALAQGAQATQTANALIQATGQITPQVINYFQQQQAANNAGSGSTF